jgi:hypothetical protein
LVAGLIFAGRKSHVATAGSGRTSPIFKALSTGSIGSAASRSGRAETIHWRRERSSLGHFREAIMNEEAFNVSLRKFLKKVGITSQREIEQAVRGALAGGRLKGNEALPAKVTLKVEDVGLSIEIEGAIELE